MDANHKKSGPADSERTETNKTIVAQGKRGRTKRPSLFGNVKTLPLIPHRMTIFCQQVPMNVAAYPLHHSIAAEGAWKMTESTLDETTAGKTR